MASYTIVTDADAIIITAGDADEAATCFANQNRLFRGVRTAEALEARVRELGGYGHMSENGVDLWHIRA